MAGGQADSNIYFYNPSLAAAILFTVLYTIPLAVLAWQTLFKHRSWYLVCLPLGALLEVNGYGQRVRSVLHPRDIAAYATSASLIVVAPLFIAAVNYICLGRLMRLVLPHDRNGQPQRVLGLRPVWITRVFVASDVASFLVQCAGSGIASAQDWDSETGLNLLIAGLALQLATNVVFMVLVAVFWNRAVFKGVVRQDAPKGWDRVIKAVTISIILIFIRSVYRLVEFALGFDGYLFTHEWIFYVFEALPMFPAICIFCFWYPGKILPRDKRAYASEENLDTEVK